MNKLLIYLFIVFVLLVYSCKKEKADKLPPSIKISYPVENVTINVMDTIYITGKVTDDKNIEYITISLKNNNNVSVVPNTTITVKNASYTLNEPFMINDIHLTSGQYYFAISASDGENIKNEYIYVNLVEYPKQRKKFYIFSNNGTVTNVYDVSNNWTSNFIGSFNGDFLEAAANSYNQQVAFCGSQSGDMVVLNAGDNTQAWKIQSVNSPTFPYFTDLYSYDQEFFLSFYDGNVRSYKSNGGGNFNTNLSTYYAASSVIYNDKIVINEKSKSGGQEKIGVYYTHFGSNFQSLSLSTETVYKVLEYISEGKVYYVSNIGVNNHLSSYDVNGNFSSVELTFPTGTIKDAIKIYEKYYMVYIDQNIYLANMNSGSYFTFLNHPNGQKIRFDEVNQEVYVIYGSTVEVYDYNTQTLKSTYNHPENISDMVVLYNK